MDYTQHIIMTRRATAGYCGRIKFDDVQVAARERYNDWMAWAPRRVRIANLIAIGLLEDDDDAPCSKCYDEAIAAATAPNGVGLDNLEVMCDCDSDDDSDCEIRCCRGEGCAECQSDNDDEPYLNRND